MHVVINAEAEALVPEAMQKALVEVHPDLAPRDIKMVLRLALRVAKKREVKPSMDIFERCLMFRGLS